MQVSVFVGATIDGFLAREDGSVDYLTPFQTGENGFDEFFRSIDALVMGRDTYDWVLGYGGPWPYKGKRLVVLTHRPIDAKHGETTHSGTLKPLIDRLAAGGVKHVYLDGGKAIRQGLEEDLVDDMTINTVPLTIGAGRPLFGCAPHTNAWKLDWVRQSRAGCVQAHYLRKR